MDALSLLTTDDRSRWFLVPDAANAPSGVLEVRDLLGVTRRLDASWLAPYEISEDQAVRWTRANLPSALTELRTSLDETLADWRARIDAARNEPVAADSTVTPNAVPALLALLRALPGIVGGSISGDDARLDSARQSLAELQQKLASSGIELDDRFTGYADRLAALRRDTGARRDTAPPRSAPDHARDDEPPPAADDPSSPDPKP